MNKSDNDKYSIISHNSELYEHRKDIYIYISNQQVNFEVKYNII